MTTTINLTLPTTVYSAYTDAAAELNKRFGNLKPPLEPKTLIAFALARRNQVALPYPTVEALRAAYQFDDLQSFLYSIGEFYSRKDLSAWMKKTFAVEIEEDNAKLEQYRQIAAPVAASSARRAPCSRAREIM